MALDLPIVSKNTENIRSELKRLVSRGILIETEPGLFAQPQPGVTAATQPGLMTKAVYHVAAMPNRADQPQRQRGTVLVRLRLPTAVVRNVRLRSSIYNQSAPLTGHHPERTQRPVSIGSGVHSVLGHIVIMA